MVTRVKDPHAAYSVPYPAETTGSGWEIRMIRAADREAAVLLFNDRQRHAKPWLQLRSVEARTGMVNKPSPHQVEVGRDDRPTMLFVTYGIEEVRDG
jgi:hypothetical protein